MNVKYRWYLHTKETNFLQIWRIPQSLIRDLRKLLIGPLQFATYEWIQQIQNEFGSSKDFRIDKVVYNGDNDITELIKKGRPIIEDDLPF